MATMAGYAGYNALSIDLEEWFHAELIRRHVRMERPQRRVEWATEPILHLLDRYGVRATFFVVGDVLQHQPDLIRRIYAEGHEIACHGWSHRTLWSLDAERFAWELAEFDREAQAILPPEEIIGFRAPTFSLDQRTAWALELLASRGYRYDSSIFPLQTSLYGVPGAPLCPYKPLPQDLTRHWEEGRIVEFPMTICRLAGFDIPVAGGIYLRALPLVLLTYLLWRVNEGGVPFVLYLHPWEADLDMPLVKGLPWLARLATYSGRRSTLTKLEALLREFRFAPLREVLGLTGERRLPAHRPARHELGEPQTLQISGAA